MSEKESVLADGIYFERPRESAPDFVKGKVSINIEKAIPFLQKHANEKGYVNLDLLVARETKKPYFKLNDWKPEKKDPMEEAIENLPEF